MVIMTLVTTILVHLPRAKHPDRYWYWIISLPPENMMPLLQMRVREVNLPTATEVVKSWASNPEWLCLPCDVL